MSTLRFIQVLLLICLMSFWTGCQETKNLNDTVEDDGYILRTPRKVNLNELTHKMLASCKKECRTCELNTNSQCHCFNPAS